MLLYRHMKEQQILCERERMYQTKVC